MVEHHLAGQQELAAGQARDGLRGQRWTGLLVPPEMLGAHVGPPTAHTTGRTHALSFRAGTAFLGHLGIEWDLTTASDAEHAEGPQYAPLPWWEHGTELPGAVLDSVGVQLPVLHPERLVLLRAVAL